MAVKSRDPWIIFPDGTTGRLINRLPVRYLEGAKKEVPLIIKLENYLIKQLGIDLEREGVDAFGRAGKGNYIRHGYDPEDIGIEIPLGIEDRMIQMACNFNGSPGWFKLKYENYLAEAKQMESLYNSYKLKNLRLRDEINVLQNHRMQNSVFYAELAEVQKGTAQVIKDKQEERDLSMEPNSNDNPER